MGIRPEVKSYEISKHRYYELQHMCYQYPEWKMKLEELMPLGRVGEEVHGGGNGSPTENLAIKRAVYEEKCTKIEKAAVEAGIMRFNNGQEINIGYYILKAVTDENFKYNDYAEKIHCSKDYFYRCRRKFFYIIDKLL